jgi:hypothetical protein
MRRRLSFRIPAILLTVTLLFPAARAGAGSIVTAYARDEVTSIGLTPGVAGNFTVKGTTSLSADYADLDSVPKGVFNNAKLDPQPVAVGPNAGAVQNNNFTLHDPHLATSDAVISSNLTAASNHAEVNLSQPDGGSSHATNELDVTFTLKHADKLTLSFTSLPFLQVSLANGVALPATANAFLTAVVQITTVVPKKIGTDVFFWRPDGGTGMGIMGGTENADPFSLNKSLTINAAGQDKFSPAFANFSATTNFLDPGTYELVFVMGEYANGSVAPFRAPGPAPEPSSLVMACIGGFVLGCYGLLRRHALRPIAT